MKTILFTIGWIASLAFMFTDNLIQALIALYWFGYFTMLLQKHKYEVTQTIKSFENRLDKIIKKYGDAKRYS